MSADRILTALRLPPEARVDKRVPKALLLENGAPTSADKRLLREGVESLTWIAALKPATGGPSAFRDDLRDYPEIAVLQVELRHESAHDRIHTLIHRAIPYPCLLLSTSTTRAAHLSLAHKRRSQGEAASWVTDAPAVVDLVALAQSTHAEAFRASLALDARPVADMADLYQGWLDAVLALRTAGLTGRFTLIADPQVRHTRLLELDEYQKLSRELASIRARAAKEKQIARRVVLSERRKSLEGAISDLLAKF